MTSLTAPSHSDNVRKLSSDPHMRCPADDAETLTTATSTPRLLGTCARCRGWCSTSAPPSRAAHYGAYGPNPNPSPIPNPNSNPNLTPAPTLTLTLGAECRSVDEARQGARAALKVRQTVWSCNAQAPIVAWRSRRRLQPYSPRLQPYAPRLQPYAPMLYVGRTSA